MIENDPHGLILSAVAICTVLLCLTILWGAYTLIGGFFVAKERKSHKKAPAAAGDEGQVAAAIAVALELYRRDTENARIITFDSPAGSAWADPARNFRKYNRK